MKYHVTDQIEVTAWDRPWLSDVLVSTSFYHLIPDDELDESFWGYADIDVRDFTKVEAANE